MSGKAPGAMLKSGIPRHSVDEVVGQHKVDVAVNVRVGAKVFVVAARVSLADALRRDTWGRLGSYIYLVSPKPFS